MNKINTIEVGVFLLPPQHLADKITMVGEVVLKQLQQIDAKLVHKVNIPHISLYQLSIPVTALNIFDAEMSKVVNNIPVIKFVLSNSLSVNSGNIFWCVKDNEHFRDLENKILNSALVDLRCGSPSQITEVNIDKLPQEKQQYLKKYGIFWIKNYCTPHFTVFYDVARYGDCVEKNMLKSIAIAAEEFIATKVAFGILDYHGNVVKVLGVYNLDKGD